MDLFIWAKIIQPVSALALFTLIARNVLGATDSSYYVIGNALVACWTSAFAGTAVMLTSDRIRGTLPFIILSPASRFMIVAGRSFFYIIDGIFTVLINLLAGSLLFGLDFSKASVPLLIAAIASGVISASCAGIFLGAGALVYRDINTIANVSMSIMLVFSGANFPVDSLPAGLYWLSYIVPLSRATAAARLAYHGAEGSALLPLLATELAVAAGYLLLGLVLYQVLERQARVRGGLGLY